MRTEAAGEAGGSNGSTAGASATSRTTGGSISAPRIETHARWRATAAPEDGPIPVVVGSSRPPKGRLGPTESPPMKPVWLQVRKRSPRAGNGAWSQTRSHTQGASEHPLTAGGEGWVHDGMTAGDGMTGEGGEAGEVKLLTEDTGDGDVEDGTPGGEAGQDFAPSREEGERTRSHVGISIARRVQIISRMDCISSIISSTTG